MRPPPNNVHEANSLECPNPLCREPVGTRRMLHGFAVERCRVCGVDYLVRGAFGVADVVGLTPEQAERFTDERLRLVDMLREIGLIGRRRAG